MGRTKIQQKRKIESIAIDTDDACSNDQFERFTKESMGIKQSNVADINVSPVK